MTEESIEVSVAVIQEQLRQIAADNAEARVARKAQYEQNERQSETMIRIEHRLEKLEVWATASDPTIKDVQTMQLKAQGAGWLGRWLWILAGASIGAAASMVGFWQRWFHGG